MLGLFKRKNTVLEQLVSELDNGLTNFANNVKKIEDDKAKVTLLESYVKIAQELDELKQKPSKKSVERLQELKHNLNRLNALTKTYNSTTTQSTTQKKVQLEGADFNPTNQKNEMKIVERTNSQPTLLPSERRMLQVKKEKGADSPLYKNKIPIQLEGANFDPRKYFEMNFKEKPKETLTTKKIEGELERMPTITTNTLESIVSEYQLQSRQKFIEKENGKIKKIKVDKIVYQGFLHSTEKLLESYLNIEKGKNNTIKRRQFESLELQVNKVLEEGMFKLNSKLNPMYTRLRTEELKEKYSYNIEESFEKQYNRLLYSSLENFEGKNDEERRFSKAKALTELLGQYIVLNNGKADRKTIIEYSRKINSYIEKHVKEKNREEIKIKVKLEDNVISLYSKQKSSFTTRITDNTDKIELGTYKLKRNKYVFVKEGKTTRQILNELAGDIIMMPFYYTGAITKMTGKGIENIGRGIKKVGNGIIYGAKKVSDTLSQPYKIEKLPRE